MKVDLKLDATRMNAAISQASVLSGKKVVELVEAAALFFTQSFAKQMPQSKKRRKMYAFDDSGRGVNGRTRQTYVIYRRRKSGKPGKFYSRRRSGLREFALIQFRGLGRQSIKAAAQAAGLRVASESVDGVVKTAAKSLSYAKVRKGSQPYIELHYLSRDVAGYPGEKAGKKAMSLSIRRLSGWAKAMAREIAVPF